MKADSHLFSWPRCVTEFAKIHFTSSIYGNRLCFYRVL